MPVDVEIQVTPIAIVKIHIRPNKFIFFLPYWTGDGLAHGIHNQRATSGYRVVICGWYTCTRARLRFNICRLRCLQWSCLVNWIRDKWLFGTPRDFMVVLGATGRAPSS